MWIQALFWPIWSVWKTLKSYQFPEDRCGLRHMLQYPFKTSDLNLPGRCVCLLCVEIRLEIKECEIPKRLWSTAACAPTSLHHWIHYLNSWSLAPPLCMPEIRHRRLHVHFCVVNKHERVFWLPFAHHNYCYLFPSRFCGLVMIPLLQLRLLGRQPLGPGWVRVGSHQSWTLAV